MESSNSQLGEASIFLHQLATRRTNSTRQEKQSLIRQLSVQTRLLPYPIPIILITGTCGKGSTASLLSSIIEANGYTAGMIQSPHLISYTERIQIDRKPVSEQQILTKIQEFLPVLQKTSNEEAGFRALNYNQAFLLIGLHLFIEQKADFVLVETGIGGYNDPASFFDPILSIITNIHMDHESILGNTLEAIAYDKSGVIKKRSPVVTGTTVPSAFEVLRQAAGMQQSPLYQLTRDFQVVLNGEGLWYQDNDTAFPFQFIVEGNFQLANAALAVKASLLLQEKGYSFNIDKIQAGLKQCTLLPGRFQVMSKSPLTVIDGAHNEEEIIRFCETVEQFGCKTHYMILGFSEDKRISSMLSAFSRLSCIFLFVPHSNTARFKDPGELAAMARLSGHQSLSFTKVEDALDYASRNANQTDGIFVTGSMFLAGDALQIWKTRS
jgi:dihydrofolate synthase/folylpolyglutamate synthase